MIAALQVVMVVTLFGAFGLFGLAISASYAGPFSAGALLWTGIVQLLTAAALGAVTEYLQRRRRGAR